VATVQQQHGKITFGKCVLYCLSNQELVKEFNRLTESSLGEDKRSALEKMIDQATGYEKKLFEQKDEEFVRFIGFVYDCVFSRLPPDIIENIGPIESA